MMSEASFASLGPTLLARKGGAKPAMRPQLTPLPDNLSEMAALAEEQLEDLGWNDMGADRDSDTPTGHAVPLLSSKRSADRASDAYAIVDPLSSADVVPIGARTERPAPANEDTLEETARHEANLDEIGALVRYETKRPARRALTDAALSALQTAGSHALAPRAITPGRRAAFTLRLDTERHLKLRLAATMQGVSAQSLVTEALDSMLESIAELDVLVERMKRT